MEDLITVEIQKIVGPTPHGAAVLLGNQEKSFVVFIGQSEAHALRRETEGERTERPMTHDLLQSVLLGFDVSIRQIVITQILDGAFCATLILEQQVADKEGEWAGRRNEVRIDARPSDCFVLALKTGTKIEVTREVFDQVADVSHLQAEDLQLTTAGAPSTPPDPGVEEDLIPDDEDFWGEADLDLPEEDSGSET